jgi:hypothetical protein
MRYMAKALTVTKRFIVFILLIIIGASLIAYFFYPSQKPSAPTYSYSVTIYDVIGNKTNVIAKNITVILQGKTYPEYNVSLKSPNLQNTTYFFDNLKAGDYQLLVYSPEKILLYNKTVSLNQDVIDRIVIPSQPLFIQVLVNNQPTKLGFDIHLKNVDRNFTLNATASYTNGTFRFAELPLGNYELYVYYLTLEINRTHFKLDGRTNVYNVNTRLLNATFILKDERIGILNETSLYLVYQNKTIGPYISSKNGTITANNIPTLKFKLIFSYKGINVTTNENPIIDFNSTSQNSFNFTTKLANLTLKVSFDNGAPAKGIGVIISPLIKAKLGDEGNVTINNLPANVNINIKLNSSSLIILNQQITLQPYEENKINLTINKLNFKLSLNTISDINNFNINVFLQNYLNKTQLIGLTYKNNIDLKLYPSIYSIYILVKTPSNSTINIYNELFVLNSTIDKSINLPLGYSIIINTSNNEDIIYLYYTDSTGKYLIGKLQGNHAEFKNLIPGDYIIVVYRGDNYITSDYIQITKNSPTTIKIDLNTYLSYNLLNSAQMSSIILSIILLLITLISYLIYRNYKFKKPK